MKVKAANGFARILKSEGIPWVSCYPTNHVNNALGEEGVPILMMGEERFAVAVADAFSRVTAGKQIGVCTVMANLNAAGIQMAYGAIGQAWEDSSPLLVITEGVGQGASRHTHYDMAEALKSVTKWVGKVDRAELIPDFTRRAFTQLRSGRPGPVLLIIPRDLGEYDEADHPYSPVKGWRSGPDPDDVRAAIRALLAAKDPLLYVGEGAVYADAGNELLEFAELAQVPVLTTLKAKGIFPENHPLSVGVRGSLAEHFLRKADVLFSIGSSLFPNRFSHAIPDADKKTIVQCTVDTLDINRSYETRHAVIGDAKLTLAGPGHRAVRARGRAQEARADRGDPRRQTGVPGEVPPVDGVERHAHQSLPRDRRPHEGARPEELVRHRGLRQHAGPDQHGVRGADPARLPRLGQRVDAGLQPGRRGGGEAGIPASPVRARHRRRRRLLHDGQLRGHRALQDRHHDAAHQQRRLLRLRAGLLGRRPRPLHLAGVGSLAGVHGVHGPGRWLSRRGRHAAVARSSRRSSGRFDENAKGRPAFLEFICSHHPVHGGWVRPASGGGH